MSTYIQNGSCVATREEVYDAVDSERSYQQTMWDGYNGEPDNPLEVGEFLTLLEEYVAQARATWCKERTKEAPDSLNAVRKVAGIAVNCMEQHGAPHRVIGGW